MSGAAMGQRYSHLSLEERCRLRGMMEMGLSIGETGRRLGRHRSTITHDNGGEFARHEAVTEAIGLHAYFCDPHSPWQRGELENANGRLRRDLPRKTSLADHTDADIDDVVWNLNATPRKCLRYQTPIEAFAANLGVALKSESSRSHRAAGRRR